MPTNHSRRAGLLAVISVGGALGGMARYGVGRLAPVSADRFPWGTFSINLVGSFLLALLLVLVLEVWPPTLYVRPFLGVGFLGAFTTFSTFALDVDRRLGSGHAPLALAYTVATLGAGLAAAYSGLLLGRLIRDRGHYGRAATEGEMS